MVLPGTIDTVSLAAMDTTTINLQDSTPAKQLDNNLSPSKTPKPEQGHHDHDGPATPKPNLPTTTALPLLAVTTPSNSTATNIDATFTTPATNKTSTTISSSTTTKQTPPSPLKSVSSKHFKKMRLLGKGDVGKVFLVQAQGIPQLTGLFAMKVYKKSDVIERKKVHRVQLEREILEQTSHPFLVSMYASFQTPSRLYVVLQYCQGGEFFRFLRKQPNQRICEEWARFYAAEVLCALEYLHFLGYIYRDLKGENILMHHTGHLILADFDLSKHQVHEFNSNEQQPSMVSFENSKTNDSSSHTASTGVADFASGGGGGGGGGGGAAVVHDQRSGTNVVLFDRKTGTTSGGKTSKAKGRTGGCGCCGGKGGVVEVPVIDTEAHLKVDRFGDQLAQSFVGTFEYIAPEIIEYQGYAGSVDWWAFGILLYEMLYGKTPFKGKDNDDTLANSYCGEFDFPTNVNTSDAVKDLLKQLLAHEVKDRLASPNSIRKHHFFQPVNWPLIRHMEPPYLPKIENILDTRNFRHFEAFVDSDDEYDGEGQTEDKKDRKDRKDGKDLKDEKDQKGKTVEEEASANAEEETGMKTPDSKHTSGSDSEEEPDMITPSHNKQDISFKAFGYVDQIGERHWGLDQAPNKYGTMEHVRNDCVESPASKAYRAQLAKE